MQDVRVLAHSRGSSPFFYSLRFSFPPPGNIQHQALSGVTLILQDSVVQPDWKCLAFNPGTRGLWSGGADVDGNERGRLLPDLRRPAGSSTLESTAPIAVQNIHSNEGVIRHQVDIPPALTTPKHPVGLVSVPIPVAPLGFHRVRIPAVVV